MSLSILALVVWLFCVHDVVAGVVCYQYEYAPNLVRSVQKILKENKLYKGPINGKYGPKTKSAVILFQHEHDIFFHGYELNHSNSGELEERTLKAMFGENAPNGVTVVSNPHHAPDEYWLKACK